MTKCDVMYYCKSAGVLLNLEADEGFLLRTLAFSRGFQCNGLVFHAEMGFLLFFLRKRFPGIPKREGEDVKLGWQM